MTDGTASKGNGGSGGEDVTVERVDIKAVVVENDPDKDYVVVRLLPDGPEVQLPRDTVVKEGE